MNVKDIMTSKNLQHCSRDTKLNEAATIMKNGNCGFLPVINENKKVIGTVTDRDICLALAEAKVKLWHTLNISGIMSNKVHTIGPDESISNALKKMRLNKIGRLVVVNKQGKMEGILSIHNIMTKAFNGEADLEGLASSGESISRTIDALNSRYAINPNY